MNDMIPKETIMSLLFVANPPYFEDWKTIIKIFGWVVFLDLSSLINKLNFLLKKK